VFGEFTDVIHLFYNFRAQDDSSFIRLLHHLRTIAYFDDRASMKQDLINVNKRRLDRHAVRCSATSPPVVLVTTNAERRAVTTAILSLLITASSATLYKWKNRSNKDLSEQEWRIVEEYYWQTSTKVKCPPTFWAYVGMPVAVSLNPTAHHQLFGVATGAYGVITEIKFHESCTFSRESNNVLNCDQIPEYVVVKFETPTEHRFADFPERCRPIGPYRSQGRTSFHKGKATALGELSVQYDYEALPLRHRFASTFQSMQCLTSTNLIMGNPKTSGFDCHKMLYMGLSRATGYKCIRILESFTIEMLQRYKPSERDLAIEQKLLQDHFRLLSKLGISQDDSELVSRQTLSV
jgi:hypothetical protein